MSEQDLMQDDLTFDQKAPEMQSVLQVKTEPDEISAGTIDESMLNEEELQRVEQIISGLDIADTKQVIEFAAPAQRSISGFSASILLKVKTAELGDIGDSLKELTVVLNSTLSPHKKGIMGLFQKAKMSIDTVRANYSKAETNVNRVEKDLRTHQDVLTRDIMMYQQMYDLNLQYYKELTLYIIAGKKALANERKGRLAELKEKAESTKKQEDVQAYRDFEDMCNRFEKKLSDLELTRMISIQMAPQIRLLQNNDREMLDKIQSSLANTIPLWRNQMVLSLGIEHSQRSIEAQKFLSEKTNELLVKNAETLKMASVEAAKESERPIVEIETLARCNNELITSINEVLQIHEQGVEQRAKAHEELVKLEEELKETLSQAE